MLLQGQTGPDDFGKFSFLGEESDIHLHVPFESIGSGDLSSGQLGASQIVANLKWVLAVFPANIHGLCLVLLSNFLGLSLLGETNCLNLLGLTS